MKMEKDLSNKTVRIMREFAAPVAQLWRAWTESQLLDQWWAPKPYHVETKRMDFRNGGQWLYCMVSPEDERHWCLANYSNIVTGVSFEVDDNFCDPEGTPNTEIPSMHWENIFRSHPSGSQVQVTISFKSEADMHAIMEMGFDQGFTMALGNLDELLAEAAHG